MVESKVLTFWNQKCDNESDAVFKLESFVGGEISVTVYFLTR